MTRAEITFRNLTLLFTAATKDAVLLVTLAPGQCSARVSGADEGGGTAIVEAYEVP